jgi:hypothetical protein
MSQQILSVRISTASVLKWNGLTARGMAGIYQDKIQNRRLKTQSLFLQVIWLVNDFKPKWIGKHRQKSINIVKRRARSFFRKYSFIYLCLIIIVYHLAVFSTVTSDDIILETSNGLQILGVTFTYYIHLYISI